MQVYFSRGLNRRRAEKTESKWNKAEGREGPGSYYSLVITRALNSSYNLKRTFSEDNLRPAEGKVNLEDRGAGEAPRERDRGSRRQLKGETAGKRKKRSKGAKERGFDGRRKTRERGTQG